MEISPAVTIGQRKHLDTTPASLEFLTEDECAKVRQVVFDLRNYWELNGRHPYFKLGAISYRDLVSNDPYSYYAIARRMNPIFLERLAWMYQQLSDVLASHLGSPVHFAMDAAIPGFHIYLAHLEPEGRDWNIHWDGHIRKVHFKGVEEADFENTISFTAAIALPKSGAGLDMWDVRISADLEEETVERLPSMPHQFYPYELGHVFVHSGEYFHRSAHMKDIGPTDERITLQGHAVQLLDKIIVYW